LKFPFPWLVVLLVLLAGCVNDLKKVEALSERGTGVEVAKNIKTYYYGPAGKLKGVLTAPVLYRYVRDTPYMVLDSGLRVDFYNDSDAVQSILTAKEGRYYEQSNNIIVRDSVKVVSMGGRRILRTQELFWDPKKQQFYTHDPATLTTPTQTILARQGLIAPADLSWYKFMQASGELKVDSGYMAPAAPPAAAPGSKDTVTQRPGT
jgi:LPS export ABC transporter protein LptC